MATADPELLFRQADAFDAASRALLPERLAEPAADATSGRTPAVLDPAGFGPFAVAPYVANSVFALELYLKCLLMLAKGKYPQIHSVLALFHDLPEDEIARVRTLHRQIFRAHFPPHAPADVGPAEPDARRRGGRRSRGRRRRAQRERPHQHEHDLAQPADEADARLDAILAGAKDAFTTSRYAHEGGSRATEGVPDVGVAIVAVRGRILTLEPGWGSG